MSYSVEDIEKMKEMALALENFVGVIQQQFIVKNGLLIGFQETAAEKIYEAMNFYVSVSHPPSRWFEDILQSPFHDTLEAAKEIKKRYFDIVKNTIELLEIDDPQKQFEQITSLQHESRTLAGILRSRAKEAEQQIKASGKAGDKHKGGRPHKYTPRQIQQFQKMFDGLIRQGQAVREAWNEVADHYSLTSGKAVEMACRRWLKENK